MVLGAVDVVDTRRREARVEVSDGKKIVFSRNHLVSKRKLGGLVAFLESELIKGPAEGR